METFADLTDQYVYISSASAYAKPPPSPIVREGITPLDNPFWQYSRDKIACEDVVIQSSLPYTIVRPSLTYGHSQIPVALGSWNKPWTIVDRMRRRKPILIHGDGTSIQVLTHHRDFAQGFLGLLGNDAALGEDFHITSDELLTWNQIYGAVADAAGLSEDEFARLATHVTTDRLVAHSPDLEGTLWGDKAHSLIYDNSKLRSVVPDYEATIPFADGIRDTIAWFESDSSRQEVDAAENARWDDIVAALDGP